MTRPLTPRETDVLRWTTQGWSTSRIADALGIAASTVRSAIARVLRALGARTVDEAIQRHNQPTTPDPAPAPDPNPEETTQTPAQIAYHAYSAATNGRTHDDRPMPTWNQLGHRIQHAWAAAAQAVLDAAAPAAPPAKPWPNRAERRRR